LNNAKTGKINIRVTFNGFLILAETPGRAESKLFDRA